MITREYTFFRVNFFVSFSVYKNKFVLRCKRVMGEENEFELIESGIYCRIYKYKDEIVLSK